VVDYRIDSFTVGKKFKAVFIIQNFGKQPARVLVSKVKTFYSTIPDFDSFKGVSFDVIDVNMYVTPDYGPVSTTVSGDMVSAEMVQKCAVGKGYVYLIGDMQYVSTVTNRIEGYRFIFRLSFYPDFNTKVIRNEEYKPASTRN
jgi:hypothetical protein